MDVFRVVTDGGVLEFVRTHRRGVALVCAPVALLAATIGLFGGFADARNAPAGVEPNSTVETGPMNITVREATVAKTLPWEDFGSEDSKQLLVHATVQSHADQPLDESVLTNALRWPEKAKQLEKGDVLEDVGSAPEATDRATDVYAPADQTAVGPLNPGIRTDVLYVWTLPADEKVPDQLRLEVHDASFAEVTTLKRTDAWLSGNAVASVRLPTDERSADAKEGGS